MEVEEGLYFLLVNAPTFSKYFVSLPFHSASGGKRTSENRQAFFQSLDSYPVFQVLAAQK